MRKATLLLVFLSLVGSSASEPLTLPLDQRPSWVEEDGIVMAGSWEPLLFRVRRDGSPGYTPTPEQKEAYDLEHTPEMVARLKALGANFVMHHCYKAFGLKAEHESMQDAVRFAKLCHDAGLKGGVYNSSGTLGWELLYQEIPRAKSWEVLDPEGKPLTYGKATYRYYWNRNHPDAQAFHRNLVRFAIEDIRTDLLHFDNYHVGPGGDSYSVVRFREYLQNTFSPEELDKAGLGNLDTIEPPLTGPPDNLARRAWLEFSCRSLADSYQDLGRYARSLREDILLECNPGGVVSWIRPPIDHGRLLEGGEAFWDEGREPGFRDGHVQSRIRTYKVARRMDNMVFAYTTSPLECAESMAFNRDCLGCICWFEYNRIVAKPGSKEPVSDAIAPYVRFFHKRRDLLRGARVLADVAVLRSFPSQAFSEEKDGQTTAEVEMALIEGRIPFQIIYDRHLEELDRYRVLVLAGCPAMSDDRVAKVRSFVEEGGALCIIGEAAIYDEWMRPRKGSALSDLESPKVIRLPTDEDVINRIEALCEGGLCAKVEAPLGLCAEYTAEPRQSLVHLVNYRTEAPAENVSVRLRPPESTRVAQVTLASPEHEEDVQIPFKREGDEVAFVVPKVNVYEIARVEFE